MSASPTRQRPHAQSLLNQIVLWTGAVVTLVFAAVIAYTTASSRDLIEQRILQDLGAENRGYVATIAAAFEDKATLILAIRDDLETYESRGQMWAYLASHTGELVFDDPRHGSIYRESFQRKLDTYRANGQLSGTRMTPQVRRLVDNIQTRHNAWGDGMKFFYIGAASNHPDPRIRAYDAYQDSSLWVPDPRVDAPYDPLVRPWYLAGQEAGRARVVFTEPYAERRTGEALVSGATAIQVEGVQGTLAGGISIQPIMDTLLRSFRERAHITIFSRGTQQATAYVATAPKYVYSSRDAMLGGHVRAYDDPDVVREPTNRDIMRLVDATRDRDSGVIPWVVGGDERLVAFDTVPHVGWKVYSSVSKAQMMADVVTAQQRSIAISLAGLLVLLSIIGIVVRRALRPLQAISRELGGIAETGDLGRRVTVGSRDEVGQMAQAVNRMLDNTAGPVRKLASHAQRIAGGDLKAELEVDAKGDIARLVDAFNEMTQRLVEFEAAHRDASPLTGLPGGVTIEAAVQHRIDREEPFVFCLFDLDNFKPFNDRYGYSRGNGVLKDLAQWIRDAVATHGAEGDFIGHVGGDDFVLIAHPDRYRAIAQAVLERFDASIPDAYDPQDRAAGRITSENRRGERATFPIMTLTICAVRGSEGGAASPIHIGERAAELKAYAKTLAGSNLVDERREP